MGHRQVDAVRYINRRMPEPEFHLEITDQSVLVRLNASGNRRFFGLLFFAGLTLLLMCVLLFVPAKHGRRSMWHDLSTSSLGSEGFLVPIFLVLSVPILMGILLGRYTKFAFPSNESFSCDRSTLTVARVRWFDIHNNDWDTHSYQLAEVRELRYRTVARAKGTSIYGLRFIARGKTQRVLPGLAPRDADRILMAIRAFGADVPNDPLLAEKLTEDSSIRA